MPKVTNKKDNKGKKPTATKKSTEKKATNKKAPTKKVETKKVETKKVNEVKSVEIKEVVKEEKKGTFANSIEIIKDDTRLLVSLCVIIVLLGLLVFMICYKRVPKTSDGKEVLATVKGKTITADDLYEKLKEDGGTDALISIIDDYIANKEVKVTDEDTKYVDEVVKYYKDYAEYYNVDLATFLINYVGLNGITTEQEFYDYVLNDYKKTLAAVKFIGDNAKEDDLKEYYKENYTDKLTAKHILIEVNSDTNEEQALATAKNLIETLNNTDTKNLDSKFNELAENNSDDTATYSNGGLIENFAKKDVVEEFWNAAYALKDGEYTKEPVKTTYGYHIILRVSSTKAEEYKEIKDEVKKAYAQSLLSSDSTLITKKWDELRKQYKLSIKDDIIKEAYENSIKEATKSKEE